MQYSVNAAIKRLQDIVNKRPEIGDAIFAIDVFDSYEAPIVAYDVDIETEGYIEQRDGKSMFLIHEHDYDADVEEDEDLSDILYW